MNIYILRHGETDSNIRSACLGRKDVPLNKRGFEQAAEAAERLAGIPFKAIYSSPLIRARLTAEAAAKPRGQEVITDNLLIERDFGTWDGMTFSEISSMYPEEYEKWKRDWHGYKIPGGEADISVRKRAEEFLAKLKRTHGREDVLIVTHLGTARHLIACLLGLTIGASRGFWLDNCGAAYIYAPAQGPAVLKRLN